MAEGISEDKPKRYRVLQHRLMVRVPGSGLPTYGGRSPWQVIAAGQGSILPPDVHEDDLKHLLSLTRRGPFGRPMLEEVTEEELLTLLCVPGRLHPRLSGYGVRSRPRAQARTPRMRLCTAASSRRPKRTEPALMPGKLRRRPRSRRLIGSCTKSCSGGTPSEPDRRGCRDHRIATGVAGQGAIRAVQAGECGRTRVWRPNVAMGREVRTSGRRDPRRRDSPPRPAALAAAEADPSARRRSIS
jgi:hypothetical protein